MIAIDSSSWTAFFAATQMSDDDVEIVSNALGDHQACLPPTENHLGQLHQRGPRMSTLGVRIPNSLPEEVKHPRPEEPRAHLGDREHRRRDDEDG